MGAYGVEQIVWINMKEPAINRYMISINNGPKWVDLLWAFPIYSPNFCASMKYKFVFSEIWENVTSDYLPI